MNDRSPRLRSFRPATVIVMLCVAALCIALPMFVLSCGTSGGVCSSACLGATPGGAQDISYARKAIENGGVPAAESLLTEGWFSEYDLALEGEKADRLLSLNLGSGVLRDAAGAPHYLVQVGMSSNLSPETFQRPPLNLALVIDKSGSMQGDKIAAARRAAHHVVRQLNAKDVLSIVAFDSDSDVLLSAREVSDKSDFEEEIDDIEAGDSTDMGAGMRDGYEQISRNLARKGYEHRMILITDALPNTGNIATDDFLSLAERWADKGVGLSAFGVGIDFGIELATAISNLRGGNYRYLANPGELADIFQNEFQFLVTPLAYDFKLALQPAQGLRVTAVHGIPGWKEGQRMAELNVATIFLSRRGGAIAVELERTGASSTTSGDAGAGEQPATPLLSAKLSYVEKSGEARAQTLAASLPGHADTRKAYFSHRGVAKTAALAFAAQAMRRACAVFHDKGDKALAAAHLQGVPELIDGAADYSGDIDMHREAHLVRKLAANINASKLSAK